MGNKMTYLLIGMLFLLVTIMFSAMYLRQDSTTSATQNVQTVMRSSDIGTIREDTTAAIDTEALVTNMALDIAKSYKGKAEDVKVDYVFLNKSGDPTTSSNSKDIDSVQFRVSVLNEKGQEVSNSAQRLNLKEVN